MPILSDEVANEGVAGAMSLITFASLHTAFSGSGANEVTGGSPAYERQAVAWDTPSGRSALNTDDVVFDVPGSTDVYWVGLWDADTSGTFYGMVPLGSTAALFVTAIASTDTFHSPAHGLSNGDQIAIRIIPGQSMPTGLNEGAIYYVIGSTTDSFQVSTSEGGSLQSFSTSATLLVQDVVPEEIVSQDTLTLPGGSLEIRSIT